LCLAIVGPLMVHSHLSEGTQIFIVRHINMVGQLVVLRAAVSSVMQSMLGCSPSENFWVDVIDEMLTEWRRPPGSFGWRKWNAGRQTSS
jgi:hypothetical protein